MRKKNGFTLVELIATITIIAVVGILSTFAYVNLLDDQKQKDYDATMGLIAEAAKRYGEEHKDTIKRATGEYEVALSKLIYLDYLDSDNKSYYKDSTPQDSKAVINDSLNGDTLDINIFLKYKINDNNMPVIHVRVTDNKLLDSGNNPKEVYNSETK